MLKEVDQMRLTRPMPSGSTSPDATSECLETFAADSPINLLAGRFAILVLG